MLLQIQNMLINCRCYGVTLISTHFLETKKWAKIYSSVIHLLVSYTLQFDDLGEVLLYLYQTADLG